LARRKQPRGGGGLFARRKNKKGKRGEPELGGERGGMITTKSAGAKLSVPKNKRGAAGKGLRGRGSGEKQEKRTSAQGDISRYGQWAPGKEGGGEGLQKGAGGVAKGNGTDRCHGATEGEVSNQWSAEQNKITKRPGRQKALGKGVSERFGVPESPGRNRTIRKRRGEPHKGKSLEVCGKKGWGGGG